MLKLGDNLLKWSILGLLVVSALWYGSAAMICSRYQSWDQRGTFGDMFGAVNALFSGLAFLGVIVAIILQKEELEEQRKEITIAREAHELSAAALTGQLTAEHTHIRMQALSLIVTSLQERINRLQANDTSANRDKSRKLTAERDAYEDTLRGMIDRYLTTEAVKLPSQE